MTPQICHTSQRKAGILTFLTELGVLGVLIISSPLRWLYVLVTDIIPFSKSISLSVKASISPNRKPPQYFSAMYLTDSFPNRSWQYLFSIPLPSKTLWEVTKEQIANLCHRSFTSTGFSANPVGKYHYHSDYCRHNMGNPLFISGVLAILKFRSLGVPDKMATIRNKVLVTCIFSFQSSSERLPILWYGINPFTCLNWERHFAPPLSKNFSTFFENKKSRLF